MDEYKERLAILLSLVNEREKMKKPRHGPKKEFHFDKSGNKVVIDSPDEKLEAEIERLKTFIPMRELGRRIEEWREILGESLLERKMKRALKEEG